MEKVTKQNILNKIDEIQTQAEANREIIPQKAAELKKAIVEYKQNSTNDDWKNYFNTMNGIDYELFLLIRNESSREMANLFIAELYKAADDMFELQQLKNKNNVL